MEINNTSQLVYDAFNSFIFSNDTKVLSKLAYKLKFLNMTQNIPGDILELGVFKGSGIASWLKLKRIFYPNAFKKVIGFDIFNSDKLISLLDGNDRACMSKLFESRNYQHTEEYISVLKQLLYKAGFQDCDFELIAGDVSITTKQFFDNRPGAKISILYMDLDLETPTYNSLNNLFDRVSNGGVVVFDEYGYHQWSESLAVDRFVKERGLTINTLDCSSPTAYIIK